MVEMKVLITGCGNNDYWYNAKAGEEFLVGENLINDFYLIKNAYIYGGENYLGQIHKNDCIKI